APAHAVVDGCHRLRGGFVEATRRGDAAARVPAPSRRVLVDGEVRATLVEVDRRPQPEELRRHPGRAAFRLSDGTHAPGAVANAGRPVGEDGELRVPDADVALPEAELGEPSDVHQQPGLGPVGEARLLDGAGASVEGEV